MCVAVIHALNEWMHEHWTYVYSDSLYSTPIISLAAGNDADASGYSALQTKSAEIIAESRAIAQFFERDTDPGFAAQMRTFLHLHEGR